VSLEPGPVWRLWWVWTEPARLLLRLVSERFGRRRAWLWLVLSTTRLAGHGAVGHAWWTLGLALVASTPVPLRMVVVPLVLVELALLGYRLRVGRPHALALWRFGWKFHRQWPRAWADTAAKTREIQSFDGGQRGESRAAAIRPVVDHPRMPWRFWLRWPVVTFRIGVAPGRTFAQFERVINAMAANMPWLHAIELEYRSDRSSFGLLHVALADVLADSATPSWADGPQPHLRLVDGPDVEDDGDEGEGVA
jgi:hypothetical protein